MTGPAYHNWKFGEIPNDPVNRLDANLKLEQDDVAAALTAHHWKFARTMPKYPHWYTLRRHWTATAGIPVENVVQFLCDDGHDDYFGETKRKYWSHGDFKYWTMGWPSAETILINRAVLDPAAEKVEIDHPTSQPPLPKIKPRQPNYDETYRTLAGLRDVLDRLHKATRPPLPPKLVEVADKVISDRINRCQC